MVTKKKVAAKKKGSAKTAAPAADLPQAPILATEEPVRISVPAQEFKFGNGVKLFPDDRPIIGLDINTLKTETNYDLNAVEATLGISRRDYFYELTDDIGDKQLPDIAMAILVRLYEAFPKVLLPFQPISWAAYLTIIGVHPGEFAQLVGRAFNAGRSWQEGGTPIRSVQLIIESFWRAGVTSTAHPVYQKFLEIADRELRLRSKIWLNSNYSDDVEVREAVFKKLGADDGAVALYKYNESGSISGIPEKMVADSIKKEEEGKSKRITKEEAIQIIIDKTIEGLAIKKAPTLKRKRRQTKELIEAEESMLQAVED